jgi:hypothetical protein
MSLSERADEWLFRKLDIYVNLALSCEVVFPGVNIKRAACRLIDAIVDAHPDAFAPGQGGCRLSVEELRRLLSLCEATDLETSCYMVICALKLEQKFGCEVIPATRTFSLDIIGVIKSLVKEATSFIGEPTSEDHHRLEQWRSKLRGITYLLEYISEPVDRLLSEGPEKYDSIEDKKFYTVKLAGSIPLIDKLFPFEPVLEDLEELGRLFQNRSVEDDENSVSPNEATLYVDDRDLSNVFELVSHLFRVRKVYSFRLSDRKDSTIAIVAAKTLESMMICANVDSVIAASLIRECLDVLHCLLLFLLATKSKDGTVFMEARNLRDFVTVILQKLIKESIEFIDNRHIVSAEEDEEISAVTVACLQLVQLIHISVGAVNQDVGAACARVTGAALAALTESNVTVDIACWISETMFIVFGEKDFDDILSSVVPDWIQRMSSLAPFLTSKSGSKGERSAYIKGTVENIKAFLEYKRS